MDTSKTGAILQVPESSPHIDAHSLIVGFFPRVILLNTRDFMDKMEDLVVGQYSELQRVRSGEMTFPEELEGQWISRYWE